MLRKKKHLTQEDLDYQAQKQKKDLTIEVCMYGESYIQKEYVEEKFKGLGFTELEIAEILNPVATNGEIVE